MHSIRPFLGPCFLFVAMLAVLSSSAEHQQNEMEYQKAVQDDRSLLDLFGEVAKTFFTNKVIPVTDVDCRWDWRSVRCEPFCSCAFKPMRGDYHLGRSCRSVYKNGCDVIESSMPDANSTQHIIQRLVKGSRVLANYSAQVARRNYNNIQAHVCRDMPEIECSENGLPPIAWQERYFCQYKIPRCESLTRVEHDVEQGIPASMDEMMAQL